MVGLRYAVVSLERQNEWTDGPVERINITQLLNNHLNAEICKFCPTKEKIHAEQEYRNQLVYAISWSPSQPEASLAAITVYIDESIEQYIDVLLDDPGDLLWETFHFARRSSISPVPVSSPDYMVQLIN